MVVRLAVGLALVVEELTTDERHTTVLKTHKDVAAVRNQFDINIMGKWAGG
jgi:hypothetical protein